MTAQFAKAGQYASQPMNGAQAYAMLKPILRNASGMETAATAAMSP